MNRIEIAKQVLMILPGALIGMLVALLRFPWWFALPFAAIAGVVSVKAAKKSWTTNGCSVDRRAGANLADRRVHINPASTSTFRIADCASSVGGAVGDLGSPYS